MLPCEQGHELSVVYYKTKSKTSHDARKKIEDCFYCPECKQFFKKETKVIQL